MTHLNRRAAILLVTIIAAGCDSGTGPDPGHRTALLTEADLPAGFAPAAPPEAEQRAGDPEACADAFDALEVTVATGPGVREVRANFATPGGFAAIQQIIREYDVGAAPAHLATARDAVAGCPRFGLAYPDGTAFAVTSAVTSDDPDGFTAAIRLDAGSLTIHESLSVRRVGDAVVVLSHTDATPPDPAVDARLMAITVDRLAGTG